MATFLGKYRGAVADVNDPRRLGRIQVTVPEVLGDSRLAWAMPCVPYAGRGIGLIALPPVGAHVWVEFEAGDPEFPVWTGCFWGEGELPAATTPGTNVLRVGDVTLVSTDPRRGTGVAVPAAAPGQAVTELTLASTGSGWAAGGRPVISIGGQEVKIVLGTLSITLQAKDGAVTVAQGAGHVTVRSDAIELSLSPSSVRVERTAATVTSAGAEVSVAPATVKLAIGASQVLMNAATVNVNNGALEVT